MNKTMIYVNDHALDRLKALATPEAIIAFIGQLQSNPETVGEYRQPDPRGRMIEVKIIGRHAVLFFSDPFAGLTKILDIRNTEAL